MTATISPLAESLIKNFGFTDINDFVIVQSRKILEEKIRLNKEKVEFYEQKYGMKYEEFIIRVIDKNDPVLSKFGIIEKEDDDFDWDASLRFYKSYSNKLESLSEPAYA